LGWLGEDGPPSATARRGFKTPEQGCATTLWAATSALLDDTPGVYCEDCDIAEPTDPTSPMARYRGVDDHAASDESAERLWAISEGLLAQAEQQTLDAYAHRSTRDANPGATPGSPALWTPTARRATLGRYGPRTAKVPDAVATSAPSLSCTRDSRWTMRPPRRSTVVCASTTPLRTGWRNLIWISTDAQC
jgi:hypothetical protein